MWPAIYYTASRFANSGAAPLSPTFDWVNRVPALDNGENMWAIYAVIEALESTGRKDYIALAANWEGYLSYLKKTALPVCTVLLLPGIITHTLDVLVCNALAIDFLSRLWKDMCGDRPCQSILYCQ